MLFRHKPSSLAVSLQSVPLLATIDVMILDNKVVLTPPPPYTPAGDPPPFSQLHRRITLSNLPPYVLLRIVHEIFPPGQSEGQRRIFYWLAMSLRRVCRSLYIGMCLSHAGYSHLISRSLHARTTVCLSPDLLIPCPRTLLVRPVSHVQL